MNTPSPSWFPDELSHAGPEHLEPTYVPTYDAKAATDPAEDLAILCDLGLNSTHTLVDLGAGTGTFALAVAPLCRRVVAVDISPVMLAALREKAAQLRIDNVECVQGGFLTYQHHGDPAAFVYSRHALHHLPDFWKAIALRRIADILQPGGVFFLRDLIYSFTPTEAPSAIEAWLANASPTPDLGWTRPELETHLQEEYSTFNWLLEPMLAQAGFRILHTERDRLHVRAAYTCIKEPESMARR